MSTRSQPLAARPVRPAGVLAWQGWAMRVPGRSSPVKIEGDFAQGYVLLADLHRPRLGVRWKQIGRRADPAKAVRSALVGEVGQLAAGEARPLDPAGGFAHGLYYQDDDPVQRDVWVGYSPASRRVLQLAFPIEKRERPLVGATLASLLDQEASGPAVWSVFELQCEVPAGMTMVRQRLHSGDLGLNFSKRGLQLAVRQVAPAGVALTRMPLPRWLANQEARQARHYRAVGEPEPADIEAPHAVLHGLARNLRRRRRYSWVWWMPASWQTICVHDEARDRLTIVQTTDPDVAAAVTASVGHAAGRLAAGGEAGEDE